MSENKKREARLAKIRNLISCACECGSENDCGRCRKLTKKLQKHSKNLDCEAFNIVARWDFWNDVDLYSLSNRHLLIIHGWTFDCNDISFRNKIMNIVRARIHSESVFVVKSQDSESRVLVTSSQDSEVDDKPQCEITKTPPIEVIEKKQPAPKPKYPTKKKWLVSHVLLGVIAVPAVLGLGWVVINHFKNTD